MGRESTLPITAEATRATRFASGRDAEEARASTRDSNHVTDNRPVRHADTLPRDGLKSVVSWPEAGGRSTKVE